MIQRWIIAAFIGFVGLTAAILSQSFRDTLRARPFLNVLPPEIPDELKQAQHSESTPAEPSEQEYLVCQNDHITGRLEAVYDDQQNLKQWVCTLDGHHVCKTNASGKWSEGVCTFPPQDMGGWPRDVLESVVKNPPSPSPDEPSIPQP